MSGRLFTLACQQAWAIQPEALQTILDIVSRENIPDFEAVAVKRGARMDGADSARIRSGVSIIPVLGPIVRRADFFSDISGATSVESLARDFNAALNDPNVSGILFEIDSPGGEVTGINEFAQMIVAARGRKPIVAYVGGTGASAAYWLASAADEIVADDSARLGSIGVVATVPNPAARNARDVQFVSSQSPHKRPDPNTETGKAQIQTLVDHLAEVFISTVATNRGVSEEKVLSDFGQGGVLVGRRAVEAGLADRLGSFESTLNELAMGKVKRKPKATPAAVAEDTEMAEKGLKERILAALGMEAEASAEATASASIEAAEAARAKVEADNKALRERLATESAARIEAEFSAFSAAQVAAGKLFPAEVAKLKESYLQAAADDLASPLAAGSRVATLTAQVEARPKHKLFEERVQADGETKLEVDAVDEKSLTPEREKKLLEMTSVGQAALHAVK